MKVEFHPSTAGDVNDGALFYRRVRPGLESEFRQEIDAAIDRIANAPLLYPLVETPIRRCIVHRFPYSILFRIVDADCVRVLVVRHHRRHPQFGSVRR
jgi:plasmid stabilization system protein ParE